MGRLALSAAAGEHPAGVNPAARLHRPPPMYATCLHCAQALGSNDVLETLPIGRRVAFDAAQGRLWVVCRHCARWNLVPFDTRLESIDAAERLFRDTRTRYSTDNIGLARVSEGLELVRIGPALRPEFAAWRYGDSFGKRRRQAALTGAGGVAVVLGLAYGFPAIGLGFGAMTVWQYTHLAHLYAGAAIRVPQQEGPPVAVSYIQVGKARLRRDSDNNLIIATPVLTTSKLSRRIGIPSGRVHDFTGETAKLLLAGLLARTNASAGSRRRVREAVAQVEAHRTLTRIIGAGPVTMSEQRIAKLPKTHRLAIEMSLHEESEQEALAGELKFLEWQWREADRVAKIADGLALEDAGAAG